MHSTSADFGLDNSVKTIAVVLSTMRSGSTLLKALLAEADDVSNLPEVNFQKFRNPSSAAREIGSLDGSRIIVLKRPAWFHETASYPQLPSVDDLKKIVLVRDAYETIASLKKMVFRKTHRVFGGLGNPLFLQYWYRVSHRLDEIGRSESASLVRYEDVLNQPTIETARLFQFLASAQSSGVDQYSKPTEFEWKWGKDDGGPRIKELRVLPPRDHGYKDRGLVRAIQNSPQVTELRQRLGYAPLP